MSFVIGITGQTGAGKGTAAKILTENNMAYIDCDLVARDVVEVGSKTLDKLCDAFSDSILNADGSLNRPELAKIAFSSPQSVRLLNSITHPAIIDRINEIIAEMDKKGEKYIVLDAPTLLESGAADICDVIITVVADEDIRLSRIMERDDIDCDAAERRMSAQPKPDFYIENSDYTVYNNGDIESLRKQISRIYDDILRNYIS
ncbi:MAG: dephospho-CoA kinase [Clostridia bacterium]|nr:dephospho-CoA kinase [Clostridia bacterium]